MKFGNNKIRALLTERDKRYQQALDDLIAGQTDKAKINLEYHEMASNIINEYKAGRLFLAAVSVGIICILFIVLMFTLPVCTTNIGLDIQCTELMFRTTEAWQSEDGISGNSMFINQLNSISQNRGPDITTSSLELTGSKLILKRLKFDSSATVWIRLSEGQLKFTGRNTSFGGKFSLRSGSVSTSDTNYSIDQPVEFPPSTFMIDSKTASIPDNPVELHVTNAAQWKIAGIKTDLLKFEENYPPGSGIFRSTILNGDIEINETGSTYEITEGQRITVKVVRTDKFYIKEENSNLHFLFRGNVSDLEGYYEGDSINFMPTWLEYIYKNERLIFIWSAILFIIGIIWSIRNVLFK